MNRGWAAAIAGVIAFSGAAIGAEESEDRCAHGLRLERALAKPSAFDEATGENPVHFARERAIDITHVSLDLTFPPLEQKRMGAVERLTFAAPWSEVESVRLDAVGLEITGVSCADCSRKAAWYHDGKVLAVAFEPPVPHGGEATLQIVYSVNDPQDGLNWIEPIPGEADGRWEVWSQGQTESNRHWFVDHDYPNDARTSEISLTVPEHNEASANGRLVSRTDNGNGTATWRYRMEQPHASYLTAIVVGDFHIGRSEWNGLPLEYWVPPHRADDVARTFDVTERMLAFFSERFDEPFPYDRYAQIVVREFTAGGMENASVTTMMEGLLQDEAADRHSRACNGNREYLIAHELGHQWFGDLLTYRSWAHTWLSEGWASYCEDIWAEHACGRDEYEYLIWTRRQSVAASDPVDAYSPLVFYRTPSAGTTFGFNGTAVYEKGACVLHMLRTRIGDEAFWRGVRLYIDGHRFADVVTDDFRAAMEEASGTDLEPFFMQWLYQPGTPQLKVGMTYDPAKRVATVTVEQTQPIADGTPAFSGDVNLWFRTVDGDDVRRPVRLSKRRDSFDVAVPSAPTAFAFDPEGAFTCGLELDLSIPMHAANAHSAPGMFARLDAVAALAESRDPRATEALAGLLRDESAFYGLRVEAAEALGRRSDPRGAETVAEFVRDGIGDFRIREAAAKGLRGADPAVARPALLLLLDDPSDRVAAEAAPSLSQMPPTEEMLGALERAFDRGGNHDAIRREALGAFANLSDERFLARAMEAGGPDASPRLRTRAVATVADIIRGREDEHPEAIDWLIARLDHPRDRMKMTAAEVLGDLRVLRAKPALQRLRDRIDNERVSRAAADALGRIDAEATGQDVSAVRGELEALKARVDALAEKQPAEPVPPPAKPKRRKFLGIF